MAFRRRKMSRGFSKRSFRRGSKVHRKNNGHHIGSMRGGIRL
nr:MAG: hypothetical protein [Microviridae sp.]